VSASLANNTLTVNNQNMKDALYREWCDSFRSLFHLLRARQCPYFYVCANTFTVLFRAAGICGLSEIHALVTPTTRGFRQSLKQEGREFCLIISFSYLLIKKYVFNGNISTTCSILIMKY